MMSTFCWMFPQIRNFGDAIAIQNVRGIHVWNFIWCSFLEPKFWLRPSLPPPPILGSRKPHGCEGVFTVFTRTHVLSMMAVYTVFTYVSSEFTYEGSIQYIYCILRMRVVYSILTEYTYEGFTIVWILSYVMLSRNNEYDFNPSVFSF